LADSVNHRLPSEPGVMSAARRSPWRYSVSVPPGVRRATLATSGSVIHTSPAGATAIPDVSPESPGVSEMAPLSVLVPTLDAAASENHGLPRGAAAMFSGA
jgi:hypothetical protein